MWFNGNSAKVPIVLLCILTLNVTDWHNSHVIVSLCAGQSIELILSLSIVLSCLPFCWSCAVLWCIHFSNLQQTAAAMPAIPLMNSGGWWCHPWRAVWDFAHSRHSKCCHITTHHTYMMSVTLFQPSLCKYVHAYLCTQETWTITSVLMAAIGNPQPYRTVHY